MTKKIKSSIWWGSLPWEQDGGAVVNYYLLKQLNYIRPNHKFYCVPKVPEQADSNALPFAEFKLVRLNKTAFSALTDFMYLNEIPLLSMFHLPHEWLEVAKNIHSINGKTLVHQTIHWENDDVFKSEALNDVDSWVVPTMWGKKVLQTVGGIKENKVKYIPHGVDLRKFYPHDTTFRREMHLKENQKVILFVGRCSKFKGAHQLIPIIKKLIAEYDCAFIIRAGVYGDRNSSENKIGRMFEMMSNQNPNMFFIPEWCPPSYLEEIMASADILVQPSGHEGFDVPLIEAFATKQAIAVSNIPNHREILGGNNRECGIFMEPTVKVGEVNDGEQDIKVPSSDMIYGTLKFLLENPDECQYMAENGYRRAQEEYDLNKIGNDWFKHIDSMFPRNHSMKMEL